MLKRAKGYLKSSAFAKEQLPPFFFFFFNILEDDGFRV